MLFQTGLIQPDVLLLGARHQIGRFHDAAVEASPLPLLVMETVGLRLLARCRGYANTPAILALRMITVKMLM